MQPTIEKEHEWLRQLVGEWTYETEVEMEPGKPPAKFSGTESVRSIGGIWIMAEGRGEMPDGGTASMFLTLGYDGEKKQFVGSWFGSMMTHLWTYTGALDASGKVLTLETTGPNCIAGAGTANFKERIELKSPDLRIFSSSMQEADGTWKPLMKCTLHRVK